MHCRQALRLLKRLLVDTAPKCVTILAYHSALNYGPSPFLFNIYLPAPSTHSTFYTVIPQELCTKVLHIKHYSYMKLQIYTLVICSEVFD